MTAQRVLVDVNPQNAGKQALADFLGYPLVIIPIAFIADAGVEQAVRAENQMSRVVQGVAVVLLNEHQL